MVQITLPDGSQREFPGPVTVAEVAASIGTGLAKAALAGKVDGKVVDTSFTMSSNASLAIITGNTQTSAMLTTSATGRPIVSGGMASGPASPRAPRSTRTPDTTLNRIAIPVGNVAGPIPV